MSLIEKIALKPCPFCGGEAHMRGCLLDERFGYAGVHEITCDDCEASIKRIDKQRHGDYPAPTSKPEAIAAWNNRAALTAIMDAGDGVQQCDREAAAAYYEARYPSDQTMPWAIREGQADSALVVQAFARHRSTAAAAERARIVAGLRGKRNIGFLAASYAIEAGEV